MAFLGVVNSEATTEGALLREVIVDKTPNPNPKNPKTPMTALHQNWHCCPKPPQAPQAPQAVPSKQAFYLFTSSKQASAVKSTYKQARGLACACLLTTLEPAWWPNGHAVPELRLAIPNCSRLFNIALLALVQAADPELRQVPDR